ncbi:MAG: FitA-like ribbon-helix-helix domain-containing protein [Acidimicrobiales bacterium]
MASTIQIRNVPEHLHKTLRSRAASAGLSLSDYLLGEVSRVANRPEIADVLARSGTRHGGPNVEEIVDAVRSGRDRT